MACTLTTGRKLPCKSAFGGIKRVYFADYGDITAITVDAPTGEATFTGTPTWYEYDVKGNSSLETTVTSSRENGMEVTGGTVVTGAAAGDLSGFTLVLEGMEETAPLFLNAAPSVSDDVIVPN